MLEGISEIRVESTVGDLIIIRKEKHMHLLNEMILFV